MQCPYCKEDDDRVVNSRPGADGTYVKRRRECNGCGRRYTTYERIEESVLRVIKKDGGREDFSLKKIISGLNKACYKRPIPAERIRELAEDVERELHRHYEGEVPSRKIGELVMVRLRDLDHVAYIRFASVYQEFKDVSDFLQEADTVLRGAPGQGAREEADSQHQDD
jgi:transcriptional repressor NrdR